MAGKLRVFAPSARALARIEARWRRGARAVAEMNRALDEDRFAGAAAPESRPKRRLSKRKLAEQAVEEAERRKRLAEADRFRREVGLI